MSTPTIRPVAPTDLDELVVLCEEHARFERALAEPEGLRERLGRAFFPTAHDGAPLALAERNAWAWVLEAGSGLGGLASAARAFATWSGRDYLELDCLYLRPEFRSRGLGGALLERVTDLGRSLDVACVQWQTPAWNAGGLRFYRRLQATEAVKHRFTLPLRD